MATARTFITRGWRTAAAILVLLIASVPCCSDHGQDAVDGDGTDKCPCNLEQCGEHCIDPSSNVNHCGACDSACTVNQACIDDSCTDLCMVDEISTAQQLETRLSNTAWFSTEGVIHYATVTQQVEIESSALGDGFLFISDVAGVTLEEPIQYGFHPEYPGSYCPGDLPIYPSNGFQRIRIAPGTSFIADLARYLPNDAGQAECPDGYYCYLWFAAHSWSCCCTDVPFWWNIVTLSAAPSMCSQSPPACSTGLAGSNHSSCYSSYEDYLTEELAGIHPDCVDHEQGYGRPGEPCSCFIVVGGDVARQVSGECNDCGKCAAEYPSTETVTDVEPGCLVL